MPIKLKNEAAGTEEIFNKIRFDEHLEVPCLTLTSSFGNEIKIDYIPKIDASWSADQFDVYLLDNPYLNAENDVFEVYSNVLNERLGWVFPITILVSNENDYSDLKNLNKYKYVTYHKLLEDNQRYLDENKIKERYLLTDFYSESTLILILNKNTTSQLGAFDINDYLLSLYKYGYSFFQEILLRKKILPKDDFIREMRTGDRRRVNIKKASYNIVSNRYIQSLFTTYLLKTDDFLVRFIFLYQIIEQLMEDEFNQIFEQSINDYSSQNISKNDLKEQLNALSKERDLIRIVFDTSHIESNLIEDFNVVFDLLFNSLRYKIKSSISDKVYDFRNLVTHSYRNVIDQVEMTNSLIHIFEEIIVCTLINYRSKVSGNFSI